MKTKTNKTIIIGKEEIAIAFNLELNKMGFISYSNLNHELTIEIIDEE